MRKRMQWVRWSIILSSALFLAACGCCVNRDSVKYNQVLVTEPYRTVDVLYKQPIGVTDVTIDYF